MTKPPVIGRTREEMAQRLAQDIPDGSYVNLGIGIPELVAKFVPAGRSLIYHTENGMLGMGPAPRPGEGDPELINAGKQRVTALPGAAYFHHADSFAMIRGGHLDLCVLGALQVAQNGDLANWSTGEPDAIPAVGGAMDLVAGVKSIFVITQHCTREGEAKLVQKCTFPLTGLAVVNRIYTDLAVIEVTPNGFRLVELSPGIDFDFVQERTAAPLLRTPERIKATDMNADADMTTQTDLSRSAALYERALKVLPGGVSRNAILRAESPDLRRVRQGLPRDRPRGRHAHRLLQQHGVPDPRPRLPRDHPCGDGADDPRHRVHDGNRDRGALCRALVQPQRARSRRCAS